MHCDPIFLELDPIRSRGWDLDLDPIQIHYFPIGTRSVPVPIRSRSRVIRSTLDPTLLPSIADKNLKIDTWHKSMPYCIKIVCQLVPVYSRSVLLHGHCSKIYLIFVKKCLTWYKISWFFNKKLDRIGSGKMARSVDPIRSRGGRIGSRSDPDPGKLDLDPDRGSWIGDPVHHCGWWFWSNEMVPCPQGSGRICSLCKKGGNKWQTHFWST